MVILKRARDRWIKCIGLHPFWCNTMNKKLSIGIIVVIVGLVIATATLVNIPWATTIIEVALVGVWIYLVWMVRKKKTKIFHDQMESKLAERRYKMLKTFLLIGGISLAVETLSAFLNDFRLMLIPSGQGIFWFSFSEPSIPNISRPPLERFQE